jgi:competence CoiA-like predicted nuclease
MSLTAQTLSGIKVFAPELTERRQGFICRFCGQPMVFVDAQLKIKHFRHKTESLCDFEPETEEHEQYKELVYKTL